MNEMNGLNGKNTNEANAMRPGQEAGRILRAPSPTTLLEGLRAT